MAASLRLLEAAAPHHPDFLVCDRFYGTDLTFPSCLRAGGNIPHFNRPVLYLVNPGRETAFSLPQSHGYHECWIKIETAGPTPITSMEIVPDMLRSMAAWVIAECVVAKGGIGGFMTFGLQNLVTYTLNPLVDYVAPYPPITTFITLTVTDRYQSRNPGDLDPMIPVALARAQKLEGDSIKESGYLKNILEAGARFWGIKAQSMTRGGRMPWWFQLQQGSEMTYECDANLGSPPTVDCTQIEWHQLSPASDSLKLRPGQVTFFHSNTCYLAISAAVAIVLNWGQVRTALATLMNTCVQHPFQPAQGGRAYFGPQPSRQVSHRGQKRQNGLSGLNALPPHVNMTIFQQQEPWKNIAAELNSCTWEAVQKRKSVKTCKAP